MNTRINIPLFQRLVDLLKTLPDEKVAMRDFFNSTSEHLIEDHHADLDTLKHTCGTTACGVGWAAMDPVILGQPLSKNSDKNRHIAEARLFHRNVDDIRPSTEMALWRFLFSDDWSSLDQHYTDDDPDEIPVDHQRPALIARLQFLLANVQYNHDGIATLGRVAVGLLLIKWCHESENDNAVSYVEEIIHDYHLMNLDDFQALYPDAEWLETDQLGHERWSNGLEEGTTHESEWFHGETENYLDGYTRNDELYFDGDDR